MNVSYISLKKFTSQLEMPFDNICIKWKKSLEYFVRFESTTKRESRAIKKKKENEDIYIKCHSK